MSKLPTRYWVPVSLAVCFTTSLLLRILPPYDQIFTNLGVKFAMNDAYYHMRLIDNLVYNFPHFSYYDPYFVFPGTTVIGGTHFFDWLVASIIWIAGLGSPTQATIDTVGVFFPPIMAALLVIPVYFIGKSIFNKWVGLIAALMIAILPGEFLGRSILGAADHHVAEVLFSTTALMFFILALKSVSTRWTRVFTILSGVFLGVYLLTWLGGLLFALIISLFLVIQIISNHLRGVSSARIAIITATVFAITLLMNYSAILPKEVLLVLGLSIILPAVLATLSWFMHRRKWHLAVFPSVIIVSSILFLVVVNWLYPSFTSYLGMFLPSGSTATTTLELQPMLFPRGQFTWSILWGNFTTTVILAPIAMVALIVSVIKDRGKAESGLLLVIWSVVMIALMLDQRRYAYYAVVDVAILVAYLSCLVVNPVIKWSTQVMATAKKKESRKARRKARRKRIKRGGTAISSRPVSADYFLPVLVVVAILLTLVPTNLTAAIQTAKTATFTPSDAWQSAMLWMRDSTPEPFGDDLYDDYSPLLEKDLPEGAVGHEFFISNGKRYLASPTPDYTVSAWWDYGYWITRIGHRVPNANPAQNKAAVERVANLFLSERDDYHGQVSDLKSRYVILDNDISLNKFYAVASWGGKDSSDYYGVYSVLDGETRRDVILFYPAYYETLLSRLYNFNGEAVIPERTVVITYDSNTVLEAKEFADYQQAVEYVASTPNTRIVGTNPTISPVPLAKMDYELVYSSVEMVNNMPDVKIFEYKGATD